MSAPKPTTAPPAAKPSFDSLEQQAFLHLWRTYDRLKALEDEIFSAHQITAQQYNLLRLLAEAHPKALPTLELHNRLVTRSPDITRMIDRLLARKLVSRRRRSDDRRVVEIGLTPAGRDLLQALSEPVRAMHEQQLGHLSQSKLANLIQLLKQARQPHEAPPASP